ncbi:MAG: DNA polymerase III subunit alpha, partial [Actinobacteria bacterium]|nr:DNA polymerase III subunit alpha [Actinomycetota bacterium]
MADPWPHLQVASSYSLQYGTATPQRLIERAAADGHDIIGLTDRDGLYGAVQWVQACQQAGLAPVLGADLAVGPLLPRPSATAGRRTPARGGLWVDERRPRIVLLARGRRGWASLCRVVSLAHGGTHTERGLPWLPWSALAEHREGLVVLLGWSSEVAAHLVNGRPARADEALRALRSLADLDVRVALTSHRTASGHRASTVAAARLWQWANGHRLPVVLAHAVRYLDRGDARVADVLDAARLLVPLNSRRVEPNNGEAHLKSPAELSAVADEIAAAAGYHPMPLLRSTRELAEECVLDPAADLGLGEVFVPELDVLLNRQQHADPAHLAQEAGRILQQQCAGAVDRAYPRPADRKAAEIRLVEELRTINELGFAGYFLTVAEVVDLIKERGIRVAARGSGAGSLVNHLLGISGVDPIRHGLLMERFLSPLRRVLPDIDIDVEAARRLEAYDLIFDRFGPERVACVSMMETYRVRHAVRDVGAALGMPPADIGSFAKAFPHIRARDARAALADLPELRNSGFGRLAARGELDSFLDLVEALDGLPRHVAMHPCGVLLSDASLLDRTPVEPSAAGYPMSQFDKVDVEEMGLLKLDVLGVRMQSSMAHALKEIERSTGERVDLDTSALDDEPTFDLIRSTRTLGCFQIESPGQRELIGKFAPETFADLIIDISLFRPGPVKSDMVTPFLRARQGWNEPRYLHPDLRSILEETYGVVVFHEQVMRIVVAMTGCSLAEADETRRSMNSPDGIDEVRVWFYPAALRRGYSLAVVEEVWDVLRAFASFGFCKAHAAAFALPTYQSAWLKAHHPAPFYAGILTHDPGMYPKRLILDDARNHGVRILGLDINQSIDAYRVESCAEGGWGIRLPFTDVKGISEHEIGSMIAGQPYASLADAWHRSGTARPTIERLVVVGAFDTIYGFTSRRQVRRRDTITRRDLLLQIADLARGVRSSADCTEQLSFELGDDQMTPSGLPEMSAAELVRAELDALGLDVSHHVMDFHVEMLRELGVTRSRELLSC